MVNKKIIKSYGLVCVITLRGEDEKKSQQLYCSPRDTTGRCSQISTVNNQQGIYNIIIIIVARSIAPNGSIYYYDPKCKNKNRNPVKYNILLHAILTHHAHELLNSFQWIYGFKNNIVLF